MLSEDDDRHDTSDRRMKNDYHSNDEDDYHSNSSDEENVVHSIGDSDSDDDYVEDSNAPHYDRIMDMKREIDTKSVDAYDDDSDSDGHDEKPAYHRSNNNGINSHRNKTSNSKYRQYLKTQLNKEGFTKLLRYQAVKRSVKWYVKRSHC